MKGNSKKLVAFVIIVTIAMFSAAAMAWDDDHKGKRTIQGDYAVTGGNTCLVAPFGFTPNLVPNINPNTNAPAWTLSTGYILGVFRFNSDGTGSFNATGHNSSQNSANAVAAGSGTFTYDFTYTVTKDGEINFTLVPCTYTSCSEAPAACASPTYYDNIPQNGVISPDREYLVVNCGAPVLLDVGTACTPSPYSFTQGGPTGKAQVACNISLSGFRIPAPLPLPLP